MSNTLINFINKLVFVIVVGPCGLMDKASDFWSEDCRFKSCHGRVKWFIFYPILGGK